MPPSVSTSLISSSTAPPGPTNDSSGDTEGGTNRVGAIVGGAPRTLIPNETGSDPAYSTGVLGSVVLLVILAVAVFFYARYRRQQQVQPQLLNKDGLGPYEQRPSIYGPPTTFGPFTSDVSLSYSAVEPEKWI